MYGSCGMVCAGEVVWGRAAHIVDGSLLNAALTAAERASALFPPDEKMLFISEGLPTARAAISI